MPLSTVPIRLPAGHESADVRVVAPVNAGQQGDTIPQLYQDYMSNMEVLWEMAMAAKTPRERGALVGGVAAIRTLLLDRGYGA